MNNIKSQSVKEREVVWHAQITPNFGILQSQPQKLQCFKVTLHWSLSSSCTSISSLWHTMACWPKISKRMRNPASVLPKMRLSSQHNYLHIAFRFRTFRCVVAPYPSVLRYYLCDTLVLHHPSLPAQHSPDRARYTPFGTLLHTDLLVRYPMKTIMCETTTKSLWASRNMRSSIAWHLIWGSSSGWENVSISTSEHCCAVPVQEGIALSCSANSRQLGLAALDFFRWISGRLS